MGISTADLRHGLQGSIPVAVFFLYVKIESPFADLKALSVPADVSVSPVKSYGSRDGLHLFFLDILLSRIPAVPLAQNHLLMTIIICAFTVIFI